MMALMCILSHASYISDLLNISIFIFVEHQNIRLDALCQHNKWMNDHSPNAVIIDIREDIGKVRFFANGGDRLDKSDHFKNSFIMILDPQNMGLDTLIVELCALLAEIWRNIHFSVMASLICMGHFVNFLT